MNAPARRTARCRRATLAVAALVGIVLGVLALATPAGAHPLGNFTTNTSAALRIRPDEVLIDYVVDLAEIPTLQARGAIDADGDDDLSSDERQTYAEDTCDAVASALTLEVGGRAVELTSADPDLSFLEGQAGLDTTRVECHLLASTPEIDGSEMVHLVDEYLTDKLGWREVVAQGDETTIVDTDVEAESASDRLRAYPEERVGSPLRELEATIRVVPGGPAAPSPDAGSSDGVLPSVDRLTELVGERRLTIPFAVFALGLSFVLGGFHALAPGHGKTVMAAYLVGAEGTRRQALLLGLTVAVTHTGGVFALALVVSNSSLAPERLYPLLGTLSGLLVAAIGVVLLRRALQFRKVFPTLGPGASTHHHHGLGGHTHDHGLLGGHSHSHGLPGDHAQDGHDPGHEPHDHEHDGHEPGHDHEGLTHTHEGQNDGHALTQDHVHDHDDHDHDGRTHTHEGHDHDLPAHSHDHAGHTHSHAGPTRDDDAHDEPVHTPRQVGHTYAHDGHAHDQVGVGVPDHEAVGRVAAGPVSAADGPLPATAARHRSATPTPVAAPTGAPSPGTEAGPVGGTEVSEGDDAAEITPSPTSATPRPPQEGTGDDAVEIAPRMQLRNMMAMGFAGGMVPSPSALVVLLGSIAIGRAWFGLLLIVAYGAGLAAVLVGAGLVIERLRHKIEPLLAHRTRPKLAALAINLPLITSVLVILGGAYLVTRAVTGA